MILGLVIASALFAAACFFLYATKKPSRTTLPGKLLTTPVDGKEHHRKSILKDDWVPKISTLYEAFQRGYEIDPNAPFIGHRQMELEGAPYAWQTYQNVSSSSKHYIRNVRLPFYLITPFYRSSI